MERMDLQPYANRTTSEQLAKPLNISNVSPERQSAIATLIQQTRSLSSLPLSVGSELALAVETWTNALEEIPDHLLGPSWRKATKDHDWSKAFPVMAILPAYKQLLIEDNERRAKAASASKYRADGTVLCYLCEDHGYAMIHVYCSSFKAWHPFAYACQCESTPLSQRRPTPILSDWQKDDYGRWIPTSAEASPDCGCAFCKRRSF